MRNLTNIECNAIAAANFSESLSSVGTSIEEGFRMYAFGVGLCVGPFLGWHCGVNTQSLVDSVGYVGAAVTGAAVGTVVTPVAFKFIANVILGSTDYVKALYNVV